MPSEGCPPRATSGGKGQQRGGSVHGPERKNHDGGTRHLGGEGCASAPCRGQGAQGSQETGSEIEAGSSHGAGWP